MTSIYVEYKSQELGEEDTATMETAKAHIKHYGNSAFKDPNLREKIYDKLPKQVPLQVLSMDQAAALGYEETQDIKYVLSKLEHNQQMYIFSTANIKREKDRRFLALRLEGFILRMRYVIYQMMIVSLAQTPSLVSASILITESIHVSIYFYYSVRYRYP